MPQVGFEPMIPVFERAKTDLVLDRAATVIGNCIFYVTTFQCPQHSLLRFWKTACSYELFWIRETVITVRSKVLFYRCQEELSFPRDA
jgi:hypothetical protein